MKYFLKIFIFIFFVSIFLIPGKTQAVTIGGVEYNNFKVWANSLNVGNISFSCYLNPAGGLFDSCGSNEWGVAILSIEDAQAINSSTGKNFSANAVIGEAYGDIAGWISFDRDKTGPPPKLTNANGDEVVDFNNRFLNKDYIAEFDPTTRRIVGWARALNACTGSNCVTGSVIDEAGYDGWILFIDSGTGVTISESGIVSGYAYGKDVIGWIDFGVGGNISVGNFEDPGNTTPVASMVVVPRIAQGAGGNFVLEVDVDGSASFDPDNGDNIVSWQWDFGDIDSPHSGVVEDTSSVVTSHTYTQEGTYVITLTVKDKVGASSSVVQSVVFLSPNLNACLISCESDAQCNTQAGNVCFKADPEQPGVCVAGPNSAPAIEQPQDVPAGYINYKCSQKDGQDNVLGICSPDIEYCLPSGTYANGDVCALPGLDWRFKEGDNYIPDFKCGVDTLLGAFCVGSLDGSEDKVYLCSGESLGFENSYVGGYTVSKEKSPKIPDMPIGLQPNGEACTKPTADSPNNCEGINGCLYYNYDLAGNASFMDRASGVYGVASCISDSPETIKDSPGCVFYGNEDGEPDLANCLPSGSFAWIPKDCAVITEGSSVRVDCTQIDPTPTDPADSVPPEYGRGCVFYDDGSIDCTYQTAVDYNGLRYPYYGCKFNPNPEDGKPAVECPGARDNISLPPNYEGCVLTDLSPASVSEPVVACDSNSSCPNGDVCVGGSCVATCDPNQVSNACGLARDCVSVCPEGWILDSSLDPAQCVQYAWPGACNGAFPSETLPEGTISTTMGLQTTEPSVCRYADNLFINGEWMPDPSQTDFDSMPASNTFTVDADGTTHSTDAGGLRELPDLNRYLVSCKSNSTGVIADACTLNIAVAAGGDGSGANSPACLNAQPVPGTNFPVDTGSVTIGLTSPDSVCKFNSVYSTDLFNLSSSKSFSNIGADGSVKESVVSDIVNGFNRYYVQCENNTSGQLSNICQINFNVGACASGYIWDPSENKCVVDTTPVCIGAIPSGNTVLPEGTTTQTIGMQTQKPSLCKFTTNKVLDVFNDPLAVNFDSDADGKNHSKLLSGLVSGDQEYYVQCESLDINQSTGSKELSDVCKIDFRIGECSAGYIWDPSTKACEFDWSTIPLCNAYLKNPATNATLDVQGGNGSFYLPEGSTNTILGINTDVDADCKISEDPLDTYIDGTMQFFETTGAKAHETLLSNLIPLPKRNNYLVRCLDKSTGSELDYCRAEIIVASSGSIGVDSNFCINNPNSPACLDPNFCLQNPSDPACVILSNPDICVLNPNAPGCPGGQQITSIQGDNICNVLGIEFQGTAPGSGIGPSNNCSIVAVLLAIVQWFAWIVALIAVVYGLRGGYTYITAAGNEARLELAKKYIIYTMVGVVVAMLSFSIVAITRAVVGI